MNSNWSKILLFSLLSFVLGWLVCCFCCGGHRGCGWHDEGCEKGGMCMHGEGMGGCCKGEGEGCMHGGKGSCCKGEGHGGCAHGEMEGKKGACCKMGHGDDAAHATIEKIKASNFEGDTTVMVEGGTVKIHKHGEDFKVEVEMTDSMHMEEKTVEVHGH